MEKLAYKFPNQKMFCSSHDNTMQSNQKFNRYASNKNNYEYYKNKELSENSKKLLIKHVLSDKQTKIVNIDKLFNKISKNNFFKCKI